MIRGIMLTRRPARPTLAKRHKALAPTVCEVCGWVPPVPSILHCHHVIPVCRGGSDEPANLAILCPNDHALAHAVSPRTKSGYHGPQTRDLLFQAVKGLRRHGNRWVREQRQQLTRRRIEAVQPLIEALRPKPRATRAETPDKTQKNQKQATNPTGGPTPPPWPEVVTAAKSRGAFFEGLPPVSNPAFS